MWKCSLVSLLLVSSLHAIGMQHGTFASRSTQGAQWQGSSTIVNERYRITVMQAYLDVEVDWEFNVGGTPPDSFTDALEIVGNLNLAQDASVVGMLLWNGDQILKAKLKSVVDAKSQYEQVVDRNAPVAPRPRDPVIFEYGWGKDNYDISIFPVKWGSTRKCRLRYLIPSVNINGTAKMPYPNALAPQIASITLLRGPGVDSFTIEGSAKTVVTGDSIRFTCADKIYQGIQLVTPILQSTAPQSTIYTAGFETGTFGGSIAQVVGLPAAEIVKRSAEKHDFVILWRWNHPQALKDYLWQIVKQSAVIEAFCSSLDQSNKRVGLIVDIQGGQRVVFDLGSKGQGSYASMMQFLDSLRGQAAPMPGASSPPRFTQGEIDSIAVQSINEFTRSLALALSLFDASTDRTRSVVIVTAGPRWIADTRQTVATPMENGVMLVPLYSLVSSTPTCDPSSVKDLYWPGMNLQGLNAASQSWTVKALITNGTSSVNKTFTVSPSGSSYRGAYYWGYVSPDLDLKLYSTIPLKPRIHWEVSSAGVTIATYDETPAIVSPYDGLQFARAMAGSTHLQAMDGILPASLASTFGFVDAQYALLALEEDVMSAADQQRYRIAGVPPLTYKDIVTAVDTVKTDGQTVNQTTPALARPASDRALKGDEVVLSLVGSRLHICLSDRLRNAGKEVRIQIFALSGRLLATIVVPMGGMQVEALLPPGLQRSRQALVVHISVGNETFVKRLIVR